MLPATVTHADAAFNVAHAGLLAASLATGRAELLGVALADRLHEPYRASAVCDLREVDAILRDAGAGPHDGLFDRRMLFDVALPADDAVGADACAGPDDRPLVNEARTLEDRALFDFGLGRHHD